MATHLDSEMWPPRVQMAIGQVVLLSGLIDMLLSVFVSKQGLSGMQLASGLIAHQEADIRLLGADYSGLYQTRNALVHSFSVTRANGSTRFERDKGNNRIVETLREDELDAHVMSWSALLQRVIVAQAQYSV